MPEVTVQPWPGETNLAGTAKSGRLAPSLSPQFVLTANLAVASPTPLVAGDFDNDGRLDFLANLNDQPGHLWLGRGDGSFVEKQVTNELPGAALALAGDFNADGTGDYCFLLTAIDGQLTSGGSADRFRIKIWDKPTSTVVYDNLMGQADSADPSTIAGGSIVIHK